MTGRCLQDEVPRGQIVRDDASDVGNQQAVLCVYPHVTPPTASRPRGTAAVLIAAMFALVISGVVSGCGTPPVASDNVAQGDRLLPAGGTPFAEPRLTWAQGRTIHYGDQSFADVVDRNITGLLRTPTGFFLRVASDGDLLHEYDDVVYWNGDTVTEVSSAIPSFEVSVNGKYAGWLERDPDESRGGLAAIRVVDLSTGRAVVSTTDGMGDPRDGAEELAELYANAWPNFEGFDALGYAYWRRAAGDIRDVRRDLGSGDEEPGIDDEEGFPRSMLWEGNRGYRALGVAAADLPAPWPRLDGLVTPDREIFVDETNGSVKVYREGAPRQPVKLPTGHPFAWFRGWADPGEHRIILLVRDRNEAGHDPAAPDDSTGWILTCDVDDATCGEPLAVKATRSLVFDDGITAQRF